METTDFTTQDGRSQLQKLRRLLARAVSECKANTAANAWLDALLDQAVVNVTADANWSRVAADSDKLSHNTRPDLVVAIGRAISESSSYGGDYKTQLLADLGDCITELAA